MAINHILIVEDQGALSGSLARRFTRRGFQISESSDANLALSILKSGQIHLCICDIHLGEELTGLDIMRMAQAEGLRVPFVFLTGHDEQTDENKAARDAGAADIFVKPTDFSVLYQRICVLLGLTPDEISTFGIKP